MSADTSNRVLTLPHWRVALRPEEYVAERIPTLAGCFETVSNTKVRLRGWDFPHVPGRHGGHTVGSDHVAAWTEFAGHIEYWRLYQSGQFFTLMAVREAADERWAEQLRELARSHYGGAVKLDAVPGFFSLLNFLYTVTEIFEFASRLTEASVYTGAVEVTIHIRGVQGFGLLPDFDRAWWEHYPLSQGSLGRSWLLPAAELVSGRGAAALEATIWFFERFGWMSIPRETLALDQRKFLEGTR